MKRLCSLIFLFGLSSFSVGAVENSGGNIPASDLSAISPDYSDTLSGDWGGSRSTMSAKGYDWEIVYKLDLLSKVSSPNKRTYGLDNLDIMLSLDGEKIAGLHGTSALLYVLSNHGGKPVVVGDHSAGLDNIETPEGSNTVKLYQAWIQQTLLNEHLSMLVGLYDLNSEFYVTEASGIFIQPVYGIGAEMAATGQNGPSVFPTASFGLRVKAENAGYYLQAVTLDGVPGDPDNQHGTHVQFNKGDGALNVMEAAIPLSAPENSHSNKLALGVWRYTARFEDLLDPAALRINRGYYVMMEKVLCYKDGSDEENINGFVRFGEADGDTTQVDMSWSAGLVFSAPFSGRDQDQWGIAYAQERNSEKYRTSNAISTATEKSLELTYRYHVMQGFVLQPMAQYLLNHSSDTAQDKSWWLGTRIEATF